VQLRWLSKSRDCGTSVEYSKHMTTATTTSTCSKCSNLKEKLGDVTQRLEAQEVQVDTLRQLMESLRSSTLIVPPVPSPPGAMQTFTPVESPASIFCTHSPSTIHAESHSPVVSPPTNPPADHRPDPTIPAVASTEPCTHPHASHDVSTTIEMLAESVTPNILQTLWAPTAVQDAHSPRSPSSAGDDHVPPACPPPAIINTDDTMAVDQPTASVPAILVSPFNLPVIQYSHPLQCPMTPGDDPLSLCPPNSITNDAMALDPEAIPLPTIVVSPANVPDDKALAPAVETVLSLGV